jgi:TPR repeat protein
MQDAAERSIDHENAFSEIPLGPSDRVNDSTADPSGGVKDVGGVRHTCPSTALLEEYLTYAWLTLRNLAQDLMREYWETQARRGDTSAMYEVAKMLDTGAYGMTPDAARAADLYRLAADKGHVGAMSDLGMMLAQGHGVMQDYDRVGR